MCQVSDRFFYAVRTLTGDGSLKERLVKAYVEQLEALRPDDVPETIRPRFELLREAITAVPATPRETSVQVSVRKMSQSDALRYTRSIVAMFAELVRVKETGERLGAVDIKAVTGSGSTAKPRSPRPPTFLSRA
jgi:hypothetical protein